MQNLYQELEFRLGLVGDPGSIEFTYPDQASVESAMGQWEAFSEQELTEEDLNILLNIVDGLDVLNIKYLGNSYSLDAVDPEDVVGLLVSYKRALGAIVYGLLGEMYQIYSDRPGIFQMMFGRRLGRLLYAQGKKDSDVLVQLAEWREQNEQNPGQFRGFMEDAVNAQAKQQKQLAVSLGLDPNVASNIARDLFLDRVKGAVIDLDAIAGEITQTGGEIVNWRIEQGKQVMKSALYVSESELSKIEDDEVRAQMRKALQSAKDLDRAAAGRKAFEKSAFNKTKHGRGDDSTIGG